VLYPAAGGSDDWAKGGAGIRYTKDIFHALQRHCTEYLKKIFPEKKQRCLIPISTFIYL
jgi:hypothetical protein